MTAQQLLLTLSYLAAPMVVAADTTEFCLDGEFNLGARYQGTEPGANEFVPTVWCVVTEDGSERAVFSGSGKSNPDMDGGWTVALLPPDLVRIVNAEDPPDIEFHGADSRAEALSVRRIDPRRLVEEHQRTPLGQVSAKIRKGQLHTLRTSADLPLRGRVPVVWEWSWKDNEHPQLKLHVDGEVFFRARGSWRNLSDDEAQQRWRVTPGSDPVQVPGEHWPARINMQRVDVADGVYLIRGVRTGFQHLVVDTAEGLVVADAPAGWVELHQIPPADLVPGLGISGLSERFIDFLAAEFPGRPIRAVALTHAHDDHAGGARAFAAADAAVYAPAENAPFLKTAFNRDNMPHDRFSDVNEDVDVIPVSTGVTLDDARNPVRLLSIGASPHGSAALGVHAVAAGYFFISDLHVPNSEADTPRVERAATECWFARWATHNLPPATVVLNSHSVSQTPVSRLENYLQSSSCRAQDDRLRAPSE
jgi:hypothetical protein